VGAQNKNKNLSHRLAEMSRLFENRFLISPKTQNTQHSKVSITKTETAFEVNPVDVLLHVPLNFAPVRTKRTTKRRFFLTLVLDVLSQRLSVLIGAIASAAPEKS
jgi:hypothetical protein